MKNVLAISNDNDLHVSLVQKHCQNLRIERYSTDKIRDISGRITSGDVEIKVNGSSFYPEVIWYRKPILPDKFFAPPIPGTEQFAQDEWARAMAWLPMAKFNDPKRWVSHPMYIQNASNRFLQQVKAQSVGFSYLDTLVTTSAQEALAFCKQHNWKVVGKVLGSPAVKVRDVVHNPVARRITEKDEEHLNNHLLNCPTIFQELIEDPTELRVTVMGYRGKAFQVIRKSNPSHLDWKMGDYDAKPYNLDGSVMTACVELVESFNLKFATMDVLIKSGKAYMIDLNPNGQWGWLDSENDRGLMTMFGKLLEET